MRTLLIQTGRQMMRYVGQQTQEMPRRLPSVGVRPSGQQILTLYKNEVKTWTQTQMPNRGAESQVTTRLSNYQKLVTEHQKPAEGMGLTEKIEKEMGKLFPEEANSTAVKTSAYENHVKAHNEKEAAPNINTRLDPKDRTELTDPRSIEVKDGNTLDRASRFESDDN